MKLLRFFGLFLALHIAAWLGTHFFMSSHPVNVLVVVDTSFAMKPKFPEIRQWLEDYEASSRYRRVMIGTDKAEIGVLDELKSKDPVFRTVFGKMSADNLQRYVASDAKEKILLSDGSITPEGWTLVTF